MNSIITIIILTLGIYLLSSYLVKKGKITAITQRRFWDVVLLIFFLITAIGGVAMALDPLFLKFIELHKKMGTVMTVVGLSHTLVHWQYFRGMMKTNH